MKPKGNKILIIAGGITALIVIAAIVGSLLFDINSFKPRIETAASGATGMDVTISGKMGLSYFPFGLTAYDIHVADKGVEMIFLEKLKLGVAFIPLLRQQLKITHCELYKPVLTIVKDTARKDNSKNDRKKPPEKGMEAGFRLKKLRLSHGTMVYEDKQAEERTELKDINLSITDLLLNNISGEILKDISFTGALNCRELRKEDLKIDNIRSPLKAGKGVITLMPLVMDIFGAKGEGDAAIDMSGVHIVYKINLKVPKLDFVKLEKSLGVKKVIGGQGDLDASLKMEENENLSLMSSMDGSFSLRGDNLITYTMDLDKVLSTYEASQNFNLVDIGAFFIAGPLGTAGLKGYGYWDVYDQTQDGQGEITHFVSHWKIKDGIAGAMDCALATPHNRIALRGNLDLVRSRYENITVAILDENGCVKLKQSITGPFGKPAIGTVSTVETLMGPIFNLYGKTKRLLQGDDCEVFYDGSVQQP